MRYLTAGESHGKYLAGILEGFPAGVRVTKQYIAAQLKRRRQAPGRSARQAIETDSFEVVSGIQKEITTGAPITVLIKNIKVFNELPFSSVPRPGHADLAGMLKYDTLNAALIRERASARETAARVALGSFALRLNELLGVCINSRIVSLGGLNEITAQSAAVELKRARAAGDTLGGVFEITAENLPAGLGNFNQWDAKLTSRMAAALMSVNGVKGFELGGGFKLATLSGLAAAKTPELSGGLDGGVTNGRALVMRCAIKPVPGLKAGTPSINLKTFKNTEAVSKTSDTTAVFAAAVIAEHAAALTLAGALLEKFGGDTFEEIKQRVKLWRLKTGKKLAYGCAVSMPMAVRRPAKR
ncbi:MAG TPA: chorismate synthase [Elusimicrobia bacterium]|nr:chorismate synthase [Elusimicrobiota bacterium]